MTKIHKHNSHKVKQQIKQTTNDQNTQDKTTVKTETRPNIKQANTCRTQNANNTRNKVQQGNDTN